uniref:G-protein coupled receptors family 1 profile domain-containing protein n=1 Tax=Strongyloides stercoralis TaxID=6248 RepID=A0A0K0E4L1_STRER
MSNPLLFPYLYEKYYLCSKSDIEDAINLANKQSTLLGYIHGLISIFFLIFYIPPVYVIIKKKFFLNSCYKIILFMCFLDIQAMIFGIFYSILSILKKSYCLCPKIHLFIGSYTLAIWTGNCCTAMILVINRIIDVFSQNYHELLFDGKKTFFWLLIPTIYMISFFVFHSSSCLSIIHHVFLFNPFVDYPSHNDTVDFNELAGPTLSINNIYFLIILVILNIIYVIKLYYNTKSYIKTEKTVKMLKKVQIQVLSICFIIFITALLYVIIQYVKVPEFIMYTTQLFYLICHGSSGIIYLFFNPSIKENVFGRLTVQNKTLLERLPRNKTMSPVTRI